MSNRKTCYFNDIMYIFYFSIKIVFGVRFLVNIYNEIMIFSLLIVLVSVSRDLTSYVLV